MIAPAALTCAAACPNGTIPDARATFLVTPAENECSAAQFRSASCGYRFGLPRRRYAIREVRTGPYTMILVCSWPSSAVARASPPESITSVRRCSRAVRSARCASVKTRIASNPPVRVRDSN